MWSSRTKLRKFEASYFLRISNRRFHWSQAKKPSVSQRRSYRCKWRPSRIFSFAERVKTSWL